MKTAKRIQLLLSPVLIAMLALMLAVVSFGWYMAELGNVEIDASDSSVDVSVSAPDYSHVDMTFIADQYDYVDNKFVLKNVGQNPEGYFGQTAEYDVSSSNNDKPYIIFYTAEIITTYPSIPLTSAYVDSITILKKGEILVNESGWEENETQFMISFYTYDEGNKTMTYVSDDFVINAQSGTVYLGIRFENPNKTDAEDAFIYDDIRFYGSQYKLGIKFTE